MTEDLVINLFDQHGRRADALLGTSRFALVGLLEDPCQEDVTPPLLRGPKDVGSVRFSVSVFLFLIPAHVVALTSFPY